MSLSVQYLARLRDVSMLAECFLVALQGRVMVNRPTPRPQAPTDVCSWVDSLAEAYAKGG